MARSKPKPKRRRIEQEVASSVAEGGQSSSTASSSLVQNDTLRAAKKSEEAMAVALLRRMSQSDVESAAAAALRENVRKYWDRLDVGGWNGIVGEEFGGEVGGDSNSPVGRKSGEGLNDAGGGGKDDGCNVDAKVSASAPSPPLPRLLLDRYPSCFSGLARISVHPSDLAVLTSLHDFIKASAGKSLSSWSGNPSDPKRRAFGFLPGTMGGESRVRERLDLSRPEVCDSSREAIEERNTNSGAMVMLKKDVPAGTEGAICRLLENFKTHVQPPTAQRYLEYSKLVAAQPNLHCGQPLLPSHVDHPLRDGFGVVIVTVAIRGGGTIMLESIGDNSSSRAAFHLPEGSAYILSGPVRNVCSHGVLADIGSEDRESLNLRLGLHALEAKEGKGGEDSEDPKADEVKW